MMTQVESKDVRAQSMPPTPGLLGKTVFERTAQWENKEEKQNQPPRDETTLTPREFCPGHREDFSHGGGSQYESRGYETAYRDGQAAPW